MSSVIQFRAMYFGMEKYELNVLLPALGLSHVSKPRRVSKLTDISFRADSDVHWRCSFDCASESLLAFEGACSTAVAAISDGGKIRMKMRVRETPLLTFLRPVDALILSQ